MINSLKLGWNSLWFYRRTNFWIWLGIVLGTAVLTGALIIGDSVRHTLHQQGLDRIGSITSVVTAGDRLFTRQLADRMEQNSEMIVAPVLLLPGIASCQDRRINQVQIIGIDERFNALWPDLGSEGATVVKNSGFDSRSGKDETTEMAGWPLPGPSDLVALPHGHLRFASVRRPPKPGDQSSSGGTVSDGSESHPHLNHGRPDSTQNMAGFYQLNRADQKDIILINSHLARKMNLESGDEIVIRIRKPGRLPGNLALANRDSLYVARRVKIGGIISDREGGRFGLNPRQVAPNNVFLPINVLSEFLELEEVANFLLITGENNNPDLLDRIGNYWTLQDMQLSVRLIEKEGLHEWELQSSRFFVDDVIRDHLEKSDMPHSRVLTYLVNSISHDGKTTPYSFVSGLESMENITPSPSPSEFGPLVVNTWLSEDLDIKSGDPLTLSYNIIDPSGALQEQSQNFRVSRVLSPEAMTGQRDLMPDIPGLSEAENCRDWDAGFSVNLEKIREKDEDYWDHYGGTPKAFISYSAAVQLWGSQYGSCTAIRFPADSISREKISQDLVNNVSPSLLGFHEISFRDEAVQASAEALDFGQLFIGLSLVVIAGALVLTGLIFRAGLGQRSEETGLLLACGYSHARILRLYLLEYFILIFTAPTVGVFGGIGYNLILIRALETVWSGAIGDTQLYLSLEIPSLLAGYFAGIFLSLGILAGGLWLFVRKSRSLSAALVAEQSTIPSDPHKKHRMILVFSWLMLLGAAFLGWQHDPSSGKQAAGIFFAVGFLLLMAVLGFLGTWLSSSGKHTVYDTGCIPGKRTLLRNHLQRDPWHSLLVVGMIALGVFAVVGVGANRHRAAPDSSRIDSGTGGFSFYAETAFPVRKNLNDPEFRYRLGLESDKLKGVNFYPVIQHGGGDASCFNLNRISRPRLLGVNTAYLKERQAFAFISPEKATDWSILDEALEDGEIPAVVDHNVMLWGLNKKIGDVLIYHDEWGRPLKIRLVAALDSSVFQGSLLISDENMNRYFPSETGARVLLIDIPGSPVKSEEFIPLIRQGLQDYGIEIMTTRERLESFMAVENTYLSIFLLLGGLGLLIGIGGFGIVAFRDILSRRSEYALMRAIGFSKNRINRLCLMEYVTLLVLGMVTGSGSALVAVWPSLLTAGNSIPWFMISGLFTAIFLAGIVSVLLAVRSGLNGSLILTLRRE